MGECRGSVRRARLLFGVLVMGALIATGCAARLAKPQPVAMKNVRPVKRASPRIMQPPSSRRNPVAKRKAMPAPRPAILPTGAGRARLARRSAWGRRLSLETGCQSGEVANCQPVARVLAFQGATARAAALYAKGCEGNDGPSCFGLARLLAMGQGVPKSPTKAQAMYLKAAKLSAEACQKGHPASCAALGWMLRTGLAVERNTTRALSLLTLACRRKHGEACFMLGTCHAFGDGTPVNPVAAVSWYQRSCRLGDPMGCNAVAYAYAHGLGVAKSPGTARVHYGLACRMGHKKSCRSARP